MRTRLNKKVKFGNIGNQAILDVLTSIMMHKTRKKLMCGDRYHLHVTV